MQKRIKTLFFAVTSHHLFKNSALVFVGSTTANFSGWLYHLFVGRILGPEKYSELSSLFAIFTFLMFSLVWCRYHFLSFFRCTKREMIMVRQTRFFDGNEKNNYSLCRWNHSVISFCSFFSAYLQIDSYVYFFLIYVIFATSTMTVPGGAALQGFQQFMPLTLVSNIGMLLRLISGIIGAFLASGGHSLLISSQISVRMQSIFPFTLPFSYESQKVDDK